MFVVIGTLVICEASPLYTSAKTKPNEPVEVAEPDISPVVVKPALKAPLILAANCLELDT